MTLTPVQLQATRGQNERRSGRTPPLGATAVRSCRRRHFSLKKTFFFLSNEIRPGTAHTIYATPARLEIGRKGDGDGGAHVGRKRRCLDTLRWRRAGETGMRHHGDKPPMRARRHFQRFLTRVSARVAVSKREARISNDIVARRVRRRGCQKLGAHEARTGRSW